MLEKIIDLIWDIVTWRHLRDKGVVFRVRGRNF